MGKVGTGQMAEVEMTFLADGSINSNQYAHRAIEAGDRGDHQATGSLRRILVFHLS